MSEPKGPPEGPASKPSSPLNYLNKRLNFPEDLPYKYLYEHISPLQFHP
jgi:hypothetical protein